VSRSNRVSRFVIMLVSVMAGLVVSGHATGTVSAQVLYGSIVGTLTDQTGAVVPKAVVTVTNTATGLARESTANDAGYYSVPNLQEGTYDVSINADGFRPYTQKGVTVQVNAVTRVDARIQLGAVNEQVTVEASPALLQTTKSDVSTTLEARTVQSLPLSGYRNYQSLINLVPGATPARYQNGSPTRPGVR
jgi:hypothetical protein